MRVSISCNWSGFKFHWIRLNGVCDTHQLGIATKNSKVGNDVVPTNLLTAYSDSTKRYDILCNTTMIVNTTPSSSLLCMKVWSTKILSYSNEYPITIRYEHIQFIKYCFNLPFANTIILMDFASFIL